MLMVVLSFNLNNLHYIKINGDNQGINGALFGYFSRWINGFLDEVMFCGWIMIFLGGAINANGRD